MLTSHPAANSKPKTFLILTLALLVVALPAALASSASAGSSGGVSVNEDGKKAGGKKKASSGKRAKYRRLWNRASNKDKRWARRTSECESGGDPDAIGGNGRYRGAFQFMKATWRSAPKSPGGDPIAFNYKTQAVVAIALKRSDGAHHWPHCG